MKILSLLLLSSSLFFAHDAKASSQDKQLPLIQDIVRTSSQNHLPASFEQQFEKNSEKIKTAIDSFFVGTEEHAERIRLFEEAHTYGQSLFKENVDGTANSRDMALVHLSYAALMSKDTIHNSLFNQVDYKNPQDILIQMNINKESSITAILNSNVLFLPVVSKTGHLTLNEINEAYSQTIAVIGVPYGNQSENTFDAVTDASPLEFVIHDMTHAYQYLLPVTEHAFQDGVSHDYKSQRQVIYKDMKENNHTDAFAIPYFLTFHEHGLTSPINQHRPSLSSNPIQNSIHFVEDFYVPADNQRDHIIKCILKSTSGFNPVLEQKDGITRFKSDAAIAMNEDDIILDKNDDEAEGDFRYFLRFQLKNQPGEIFQLNHVSYQQTLKLAVDFATLLNVYGAGLDIPEDITHFNMNAFIHTISKGLNDFNKAYGHFFDAV